MRYDPFFSEEMQMLHTKTNELERSVILVPQPEKNNSISNTYLYTLVLIVLYPQNESNKLLIYA